MFVPVPAPAVLVMSVARRKLALDVAVPVDTSLIAWLIFQAEISFNDAGATKAGPKMALAPLEAMIAVEPNLTATRPSPTPVDVNWVTNWPLTYSSKRSFSLSLNQPECFWPWCISVCHCLSFNAI